MTQIFVKKQAAAQLSTQSETVPLCSYPNPHIVSLQRKENGI